MSSKDNEFSTRHRTEEDALDLAEEILAQKKTTENSRQPYI